RRSSAGSWRWWCVWATARPTTRAGTTEPGFKTASGLLRVARAEGLHHVGVTFLAVDRVPDRPDRPSLGQVGDGVQADAGPAVGGLAADHGAGALAAAEQVGLGGPPGVVAGDPVAALAVAGHAVEPGLGGGDGQAPPPLAVPDERERLYLAGAVVDAADG